MNVWQICQALKSILQDQIWVGGTAPVFDADSVRVIPQGDEIEALNENIIPPLCIISPLGGELDPQHREEPTYVMRNIDITLVAVNTGDRVGEAPVMGANSADAITSPGRGLLELEDRLFDAISKLNIQQGIVIQFAGMGIGQVRRDQADNFVAIQDYTFQVWCSTINEYPGISEAGFIGHSGAINYRWRYPAVLSGVTRRAILVYKSGAVPPTSISDGTQVILSGWASFALVNGEVTPLAPGTWSVSVFVTYSLLNESPQTDRFISPKVSGTVIVS